MLINFKMIGTQVGTEQRSPSLTVNFGDLGPGGTAIARFLMTSSLQGQFIDYEVTYEHVTGLGDPQLSLIDSAEIFELIHVVRVDRPVDDLMPDFLTNQRTPTSDPPDPQENPPGPSANPDLIDLPDTLHLSDGTTAFVSPVLGDKVTVTPTGAAPDFRAIVQAATPGGWAYIKFPDPYDGAYDLTRVTRSDGSEVRLNDNVWTTDRTFIEHGQQPVYHHRIHIFDQSGDGQYTLFFMPADVSPPRVLKWESLATHGTGTPVEVPLEIPADGSFCEPREAGIRKLRVQFSEPIAADSFGFVSVRGTNGPEEDDEINVPANTINATLAPDRLSATIAFDPPLPDNARYCVALVSCTDDTGNPLVERASATMTALVGDATGDHRVNVVDMGGIRSLVFKPFDPGDPLHVRSDLDGNGIINIVDMTAAKMRSRNDAREIHEPCVSGPELLQLAEEAHQLHRLTTTADGTPIPEPTLIGPKGDS